MPVALCTTSAPADSISTTCCAAVTPPTPIRASLNCRRLMISRADCTKFSAACLMGAPQTPLVGLSGPRADEPSGVTICLHEQLRCRNMMRTTVCCTSNTTESYQCSTLSSCCALFWALCYCETASCFGALYCCCCFQHS